MGNQILNSSEKNCLGSALAEDFMNFFNRGVQVWIIAFKILLTLQIFDFLFSLNYDFKLSTLSRSVI